MKQKLLTTSFKDPMTQEEYQLLGYKGKNELDTGLFNDWIDCWFGCKGKRRFKTKDEINREIFRLMEDSFLNTTNLRGYKCKSCKGYHLTSKI